MLTTRLLPPEEWPRLVADRVEPFATHGLPDDPDRWRMLVAEEDGRIVGLSTLVEVVQNHWWIAPSARRSPSVVLGLWRETKRILDENAVQVIHATVDDRQVDVQMMIERLGYVPADGKLYLLYVPDAVLSLKG